jgi:hypothetical protein
MVMTVPQDAQDLGLLDGDEYMYLEAVGKTQVFKFD